MQQLAESVPDNGGVMFVPAFTGLGAPHWKPDARGTIVGLTRGSTIAHIARAALESIAFQSAALLEAMSKDVVAAGGAPVAELRVDGGASVNDLLMQFQADLLGIPVIRPKVIETTALGAAYLAGLVVRRLVGHRRARRAVAGRAHLPPDDVARARGEPDAAMGARGGAGDRLSALDCRRGPGEDAPARRRASGDRRFGLVADRADANDGRRSRRPRAGAAGRRPGRPDRCRSAGPRG